MGLPWSIRWAPHPPGDPRGRSQRRDRAHGESDPSRNAEATVTPRGVRRPGWVYQVSREPADSHPYWISHQAISDEE